jgi:hypothetical protein
LRKAFDDEKIYNSGKINMPLLLFGFMYREASQAMEMEPGENDSRFPLHLVNSRIGILQVENLQKFYQQCQTAFLILSQNPEKVLGKHLAIQPWFSCFNLFLNFVFVFFLFLS